MTRATAILARYVGGHVYVGGPPREMYLELGGVKSETQAKALCQEVLANQQLVETVTAISGETSLATSLPGAGWGLGDKLDGEMVTTISAVLDDDKVTITPGLVGTVTIKLEAEERKLQRAAAGVQNLWGTPQYTRETTGARVDTTPPQISFDGVLKPRYAPIWQAPKAWMGAWMDIVVAKAGWGDTTFVLAKVFQTGPSAGAVVPVCRLILKAGTRRNAVKIPDGWQIGEQLIVYCSKSGGCDTATVSLRGAMV